MTNKDLKHVGVLGMHWGHRKVNANSSSDHKTTASLQSKKTHELTNEELKKVTNRLQLEKSYKDLSPSAIRAGKRRVETIIVGAATVVATAYAVKYFTAGVELALKAASKVK